MELNFIATCIQIDGKTNLKGKYTCNKHALVWTAFIYLQCLMHLVELQLSLSSVMIRLQQEYWMYNIPSMPKKQSLKYLTLENATALSVSKQEVSQPEIPLIYLSKSVLIGLVKTIFEGLKTF